MFFFLQSYAFVLPSLFFFFFYLFFLCYLICCSRTGRMLTLPNLWFDLLFPADLPCTHTELFYDTETCERHVDSGKRMLTVQFETFWRIHLCDESLSHFLAFSRNLSKSSSTNIYWHAFCSGWILRCTNGRSVITWEWLGWHRIIGHRKSIPLWFSHVILFPWRQIQKPGK